MTQRRARIDWSRNVVVALAFLACATSCSDRDPVQPKVAGDWAGIRPSTFDQPTRQERESAAKIARVIAVALDDRQVRALLFDALASTNNAEHKLHLASFVRARGAMILQEGERRTGIRREELLTAIGAVRELELYMPVPAHRSRWTSEATPLVMVSLSEDDQPVAYDAFGTPRPLHRGYPPTQPVVVAVPLESDLSSQIARNIAGKAETPCVGSTNESLEKAWKRCHRLKAADKGDRLGLTSQNSIAQLDGLYLQNIELYGNQCGNECWWFGDPEYEFHVRFPSSAGQPGRDRQCTGDNTDALMGYYQAGEKSAAYKWDMNGNSWAGTQKLLNGPSLDEAFGVGGFTLELWEDDTYPCRITAQDVSWQSLAATYVGVAITVAALRNDPQNIWTVIGVVLAGWGPGDLFNGGDDLVGVVMDPQGPFTTTWNTNKVIVKEDKLVGRAFLQIYDANPPPPGPTASVQISQQSGTLLPVGAMMSYQAWGVDANGRAAPDRPVSWSSSNASVASIDSEGWVSGVEQGTATITATVDGIAGSTVLNVSIVPSVSGPTLVAANQSNTWSASVDGGHPPYTYQWFVGGNSSVNTPEVTTSLAQGSFIAVEVWDSHGAHGVSDPMFYVQVDGCTGIGCEPPQIVQRPSKGKPPSARPRR